MLERLLTYEEVAHITGLHKSSLYRKANDENDPFPKPYSYGPRYSRFKESEIKAWIDQLEHALMPKDPRHNIWWRDHTELNQIELAANKAGFSGSQWVRHVVREKLSEQNHIEKYMHEINRSILMSRDLLEKKSDLDEVEAARLRADRFLRKEVDHV